MIAVGENVEKFTQFYDIFSAKIVSNFSDFHSNCQLHKRDNN